MLFFFTDCFLSVKTYVIFSASPVYFSFFISLNLSHCITLSDILRSTYGEKGCACDGMHNWWYRIRVVRVFNQCRVWVPVEVIYFPLAYSCQNLLKRGYTVYATSRSAKTIVGLDHPRAKLMSLDVTNDQQVIDVVNTIIENDGQIDLLINNVGILAPG